MKEAIRRCYRQMANGTYLGRSCSRKGVVFRAGKWYCKQHDPVSVAARNKARNARWDRQWDLEHQRDEASARTEKAEGKIVKYAIELLGLGYDLKGLLLRKAVAALRKAQAARKAAVEQLEELGAKK